MITSPNDPRVADSNNPRPDRASADDASFSDRIRDARRILGEAASAGTDLARAHADLAKLEIRTKVRRAFVLTAGALAGLVALAVSVVVAILGAARFAESVTSWPDGAASALVGACILAGTLAIVVASFAVADRKSLARTRKAYEARDETPNDPAA